MRLECEGQLDPSGYETIGSELTVHRGTRDWYHCGHAEERDRQQRPRFGNRQRTNPVF